MSISAISGPSPIASSANPSFHDEANPAPAHDTFKSQKKASEPPPPPPSDQVELSERSQVAKLAEQGEDPSQIAAHLGLSVPIVQTDLFPTDVTSVTALPAVDFNA